MSDSEGKRNPGGFRSDPDPAPRPESHSVDSALDELQRRRRRVPRRPAANGSDPSPPPREAAAEPRDEHAAEVAGDEAGELPSPLNGAAEPEHSLEDAEPRSGDDEGGEPDGGEPRGEGSYTVMLDGQPRQVPASELIAGYMRSADYTRKTQAATQQQAQFAEAFQVFTKAREQLEQRLQRFTTEAAREFEQPIDWVKLAKTDPMGWAEKRARFDAMKEAEAEQSRLRELRHTEENARKQEMLQSGHQVLIKAIPGWKDTATRTKLQSDMKEYAMSVGYTAQDLAADVLDPRQLIVLHDATLGRRMQSRRVTPQPPERQPTLDRGGRATPAAPTRREQDAERTFGRKPSVDNAVALLKARHGKRPPRTN